MKSTRAFAGALCLTGVLLSSAMAYAYSGCLSGSFTDWNDNGNFCDSSVQDCTGSMYPKSLFDAAVPHANAHSEIWQGSNVIGQGATDDNGNFAISWSSADISTPAYIRWFSQQKDGRFVVNDTAGERMNTYSWTFPLTDGTTCGSPQATGSWQGGYSGSPQWWGNVYWAAELEWRTSFDLVGVLQSNYTNVEIRGLASSQPSFLGDCETSCSDGATMRIQLDDNAGYSPQGRILHESGHIANYAARAFHNGGNYCWPNTSAPDYGGGSSCGWTLGDDPEWGASSFEEGLATFAGDSTLWLPNATEPTSCISSSSCPLNSSTNIEQTDYPYGMNNCVQTATDSESRWALTTMRLLWDIYDDVQDADGDTMDEGYTAYWHLYANMGNYPAGIDFDDIDEPFSDTTYTTIDNHDGRGSSSYVDHYSAAYVSVGLLHTDNCSGI